ncbi:unnamed protein product [Rotaria sp. Silwood1]|nr:unnamed protein product [Rotaria sp. Silwood1]
MYSSISSTAATHIITGIEWGIDLVVLLQLPVDHDKAVQIDTILNKLLSSLLHEESICPLTQDEESLLEHIVHTKVYTYVSGLNHVTKVRDVCHYIKENINNISDYPITYILQPIKDFSRQHNEECRKFTLLSKELNENIEDYVLKLIVDREKLQNTILEDMPKFSSEYLKHQQNNIQIQWLNVNEKITNEIKRLSNFVIQIRSGEAENLFIKQIFNDNEQMIIKNSIDELKQNVKHLEEKEHFIRCLNQQNFQYLNVIEYNIDQSDNENSIEHKLVQNHQHYRILCSNDYLNKNNSEELQKLICDLIEEAKNNSSLHLIYADFSDCSFPLSTMMVLSSLKKAHEDMIDQLSSELSTAMETFTVLFKQE